MVLFKLGALPGQVFLPLPGEQPTEAKAGGGFATGRARVPHPKGRAAQAGPRRGASRSLEGCQLCAAWSCSGAARSGLGLSPVSLLLLPLLFPPLHLEVGCACHRLYSHELLRLPPGLSCRQPLAATRTPTQARPSPLRL